MTPRLEEARPTDLLSLRLVLRQHLEELRNRGADDSTLRPIEEELRRYSETLDHWVGGVGGTAERGLDHGRMR